MAFTELETEFDLMEVYENEETIRCKLTVNERGVFISFEGYRDYYGADNVLIEFAKDHPSVVIWGDINKEDPTHIISLEGAKEDKRDEHR